MYAGVYETLALEETSNFPGIHEWSFLAKGREGMSVLSVRAELFQFKKHPGRVRKDERERERNFEEFDRILEAAVVVAVES